MKAAKLERELNERTKEKELLVAGLERFSNHAKMWIMLASWYADHGDLKEARETYKKAIKNCPTHVDTWLCSARLEVAQQNFSKARSILESSRLRIPANPLLWLQSIRTEMLAKQEKVAQQLQAKAFQECPSAGILWAHAIATDPRATRKGRSYDALKRCNDDAHVAGAVARLFWLDRKIKKARNWFQRAVTVDPDLGDVWAYYYKFEGENAKTDNGVAQEQVVKRCVDADPHHGELWCAVSKAVANSRLKAEAILKLVAENIHDVFPAI